MNELTASQQDGNALRSFDSHIEQEKLFALLRRQALLYTGGASSSLETGVATELLRSIAFTLQTAKRADARADIDERSLEYGRRLLAKRIQRAKALYTRAVKTAYSAGNISYIDTIHSIAGFFDKYDYRRFAHAIPCDIDYQLALPLDESLLGVDYIESYLRAIICENEFCMSFEPMLALRLLSASCPDPRGQLINIYELLAANALCLCAVAGDPLALSVSDEELERFYELCETTCASRIFASAANALAKTLSLNEAGGRYLCAAAAALEPRVRLAVECSSLRGVFPRF